MGSIRGSSLVKAVGFRGELGSTDTLRIQFSDGAVIDFKNVPYSIYRGLVLSKDPSAYYHKHIHGKFDYKKLAA